MNPIVNTKVKDESAFNKLELSKSSKVILMIPVINSVFLTSARNSIKEKYHNSEVIKKVNFISSQASKFNHIGLVAMAVIALAIFAFHKLSIGEISVLGLVAFTSILNFFYIEVISNRDSMDEMFTF